MSTLSKRKLPEVYENDSNLSARSGKSNRAKITAPNGSVISRNSDVYSVPSKYNKSGTNTRKSSVQGSIISHTKSETLNTHTKKGGSILSGVSNQIARRKKLQEVYENDSVLSKKERAMSVTSLSSRKSNDYSNLTAQLKRYSQSDVAIAIRTEIQSMSKEERNLLMSTIDKCEKQQKIEKRREIALNKKIKEIQSHRPPYSEFQSNICYICQSSFWPILFAKIACTRCKIFVCKNCLKPYQNSSICTQCYEEMIFLSKSDLLLKKRKHNDDSDSEENIDIDTIKKMITQAEKIKPPSPIDVYDNFDGVSKVSSSNQSRSKTKFGKRKDDTYSLTKSNKSINSLGKTNDILSMTNINSSDVKTFPEDQNEFSLLRQGEIMIGVSYNFNKEEFRVVVKKCKNLEIAIPYQKSSNPYVTIEFLPHMPNEKIRKTKVISNNLNPDFNEQYKFKNVKYEDVISRSVLVSVWHSETLGRDIFLGQVLLRLDKYSLEELTPYWYPLKDRAPATIHPTLSKYYGDVQFRLMYSKSVNSAMSEYGEIDEYSTLSSNAGLITLWLTQASNLLTSSYSSLPTSYAKCLLLPESSTLPAKKSQIIRKNFNPMWKIPFTFTNISFAELPNLGIELTIWDKRLLRDGFLGGVSLNKSRNGRPVPNTEKEVWKKMIDKPETWIEAKLNLRKDLNK